MRIWRCAVVCLVAGVLALFASAWTQGAPDHLSAKLGNTGGICLLLAGILIFAAIESKR